MRASSRGRVQPIASGTDDRSTDLRDDQIMTTREYPMTTSTPAEERDIDFSLIKDDTSGIHKEDR